MAGSDPLNRKRIDELRLESRVRSIARQLLYREHPRRATPRLLDEIVRRVMLQLGERE